jgi:hypothetical protein
MSFLGIDIGTSVCKTVMFGRPITTLNLAQAGCLGVAMLTARFARYSELYLAPRRTTL